MRVRVVKYYFEQKKTRENRAPGHARSAFTTCLYVRVQVCAAVVVVVVRVVIGVVDGGCGGGGGVLVVLVFVPVACIHSHGAPAYITRRCRRRPYPFRRHRPSPYAVRPPSDTLGKGARANDDPGPAVRSARYQLPSKSIAAGVDVRGAVRLGAVRCGALEANGVVVRTARGRRWWTIGPRTSSPFSSAVYPRHLLLLATPYLPDQPGKCFPPSANNFPAVVQQQPPRVSVALKRVFSLHRPPPLPRRPKAFFIRAYLG